MARNTDWDEVKIGTRSFINGNEWSLNEQRHYFFTSFELVNRISKAGRQYKNYFVYLWDKDQKKELCLAVMPNQMEPFKAARPRQFDGINITKVSDGQYEGYKVQISGQSITPEARPELPEYQDANQTALPATPNTAAYNKPEASEVDISDIPF